jgi:hypothetical protein
LIIEFNRFSDRDLMMRFRGGGVGHASTREATDFFKKDRDSRDVKKVVVEDDGDYYQTQHESTARIQSPSTTDRDDEEEDYGYNRGQFSDTDEEEKEEDDEYPDDKSESDDNGGDVDEVMDDFGYGEM